MKKQLIDNLIEIKELLKELSPEQYSRKLEILSHASIGQHTRHILEFFQCLYDCKSTQVVNYDERKRDLTLENELPIALESIGLIIDFILEVKSDFPLSFTANYSIEHNTESLQISSTFYRELAYNLEHSIHHQALIKVAVNDMKLSNLVSETFGFAPSTIRNQKKCAQ